MTVHRFDAVRTSPFYRSEHEAFRQSLRKFVAREIEPFANDWDEAGEFPRELYKKAAAVGYMGLGFPERYGGTEGDRFMRIIAMQEIGRAGCGGVAARTGGPGASGVSLILVEGQPEGLQRTSLKKMGWWCSDTATLYFENCRVPAENLIGEEGAGFRAIMLNFNDERLHGAAGAISAARVCLEEAIAYAKDRVTFGKPIVQHQVIRHKLVDMAQRIEASQAMLELLTWRLEQGENPVAEICMLKNQATTTLAFCASEGVQIFGGAGFMRGVKVERIYREVKVNAIGAGTEEIMKDLASRQMGL